MPDRARKLGWLTPNTWALEGYSAVFWRSAPLAAVLRYCGVLAASAVVSPDLTY